MAHLSTSLMRRVKHIDSVYLPIVSSYAPCSLGDHYGNEEYKHPTPGAITGLRLDSYDRFVHFHLDGDLPCYGTGRMFCDNFLAERLEVEWLWAALVSAATRDAEICVPSRLGMYATLKPHFFGKNYLSITLTRPFKRNDDTLSSDLGLFSENEGLVTLWDKIESIAPPKTRSTNINMTYACKSKAHNPQAVLATAKLDKPDLLFNRDCIRVLGACIFCIERISAVTKDVSGDDYNVYGVVN